MADEEKAPRTVLYPRAPSLDPQSLPSIFGISYSIRANIFYAARLLFPQFAQSVVKYISVVRNRQFVGVKKRWITIEVAKFDFIDVKFSMTPTISLRDPVHSRVAASSFHVENHRSDFFVFEAAHNMVINRAAILTQNVFYMNRQEVLI